MRTILTLILVSVLFVSVNGQTYHSFPDSGAVWSVNTDKYFKNGDTLINGVNYKKYYKSVNDYSFDLIDASFVRYVAAVREDSAKRVWAIAKDATSEKLLYDFSLGLGDTAVVYPIGDFSSDFGTSPIRINIVKIDSIKINSVYRKRYGLFWCGSPSWPSSCDEYWIEGVGSTFSLFDPGYGTYNFAFTHPELLCFHLHDTANYIQCWDSSCYREDFSNIETTNTSKNAGAFYPNPMTSKSTFHISNMNELNYRLELYDMTGRLSTTYQITHNDFLIDVSDLLPGVYLYRLLGKKNVKDIGKIMIK